MTEVSRIQSTESKTFKVLSIDGGGIKGLYSARILEHFEKKFNCQISDHFDLICGTSTGGLIALAISLRIPVSLISSLYYERGKRIFPQKHSKLRSLKQVFLRSKYQNTELKQALKEIFAHRTIGESNSLLCIPAFSLTDGRPFIFKYDHKEGDLCRDNNTKYLDVALATSAAPTYLPIVNIDTYDQKQFVDGGVYANNPTLIGVMEALRYFVGDGNEFQKLKVLSISSLKPTPGKRMIQKSERSVLDWKQDLITTFSEGQEYLTGYFVETLSKHCNYDFEYLRIPSVSLSVEHSSTINMDNTSPESINLISQMGNDQAVLWSKKLEVVDFFKEAKQYIIR
jgi:uncharacterized protein